MAKCLNKNTAFYKNLVEQNYDSKEIIDINLKIEQPAFKEWYGSGELDTFGNPEVINKIYLQNEKGEQITFNDLLNDKQYEKRQFYTKDLTYIDKVKSFLNESRIGVQKRISAYHGTKYAEKLEELLIDLDKLDKLDYVSALNTHTEYILKTLENFEASLYAHDRVNTAKLSKEEKEEHETKFKNFLSHSSNFLQTFSKIRDLETPKIEGLEVTKIIKNLKDVENRVTELQNRINSELETSVRKTLEHLITNPDVRRGVIDFLAAQTDESKVQLLLDALGDSHVTFLAAVDKYYKLNMADKDEESKKLKKQWKEFVDGFDGGFDTFLDKVLEKDSEGSRTGRFIPEFKNEYYEEMYKHINKLKSLDNEDKKDTQEYIDVKEEFYSWKRNNQEQKFVKSYYDALNSLSPKAKNAKAVIDEAKHKILSKGVDKLTPDDWEAVLKLDEEFRWLKSTLNPDGTKKEGEALEIAENLFEYSQSLGQFYESKGIKQQAFDKAQKEAEEKGLEHYEKWLHYNTSEQFADEFWNKFKGIMSQLPKAGNILEIDEKIKKLLIGYKNEQGETKVEDIPEDVRKEISDLEAEKAAIRESNKINKVRTTNLPKKELEKLFNQMRNLVQFAPTSYYLNVRTEKERRVKEAEETVNKSKNTSGAIQANKELAEAEADLKKWMAKNHAYNPYTEELEPLSIWTTMRPRNPKFIERKPNNRWKVSDIKKEYINPNFNEDFNGYPTPTKEWINPAFESLSEADKKSLNALQDKLQYLVEHTKDNIIKKGYLPAIPKEKLDKAPKEEKDYSAKAITEADEIVRFIPLKYVKRLNQRDLPKVEDGMSEEEIKKIETERDEIARENKLNHGEAINYDLASTMRSFIDASLTHKYKTRMELDIKLFKEQLKRMKIKQTDAKNAKIYDKIKSVVKGEKTEFETSAIGSNTEKHFNEWLEAVFYEDFELDEGKLSDIANKIQSFTSLRALGFNVLSGLNNKLIGNLQGRIESAGGRYYTYKDYRNARRLYFNNITTFIADRDKDTGSNFMTAYLKEFDILVSQDELSGRPEGLVKTMLHKLKMVKDSAYFMQHVGEHQVQNATLIAMSTSHRIVNGEILTFSEYYEKHKIEIGIDEPFDEWNKKFEANDQLKKTLTEKFESNPTLLDAYEFKDGEVQIKEGINIDKVRIQEFKLRVLGINQRLHGIYNTEDAAMIQRHALGRLGMQFRKWMRPGWNRRFGSKFGKKVYNERIRDYEEGMYVTTAKYLWSPFAKNWKEYQESQENIAVKAFGTLLKGFRDLIFRSKIRWHNLSEIEKANIKKSAWEFLFLISVTALGLAIKNLKGDDDDDLKDKMTTLVLYQCDRLFGELSTFTPFGVVREGNRLFKSPSPVFNTFEDIGKLSGAIFMYPFRDDEERTFKTGIYHGEDRIKTYASDFIPVYNQLHRMMYMQENNQRYGMFK